MGAFHHPTFTRADGADHKVAPQSQYPLPDVSRAESGARLLHPTSTWFGSWSRLIPFFLALVCGFAGTRTTGGAWLLAHVISVAPWVDISAPAGGASQFLWALGGVGVFAIAALGVRAAVMLGRRIYSHGLSRPAEMRTFFDLWKHDHFGAFRHLLDPMRSYWLPWLIGSVAIAPFVTFHLWGDEVRGFGLTVAAIVIVCLLPLAAPIATAIWLAKHTTPAQRGWIVVASLLHAVAQVGTAIVMSRLFTANVHTALWAVAAFVAGTAMLYLARPLYRSARHAATVGIAALWIIAMLLQLLALTHATNGDSVGTDASWLRETARYLGSALAAMPVGTLWFIWYLAVTSRLGAHNNEVGGTARISKFRQLIRFHVTAAGLTGYVISIENAPTEKRPAAQTAGQHLQFRLVDVFTIATP